MAVPMIPGQFHSTYMKFLLNSLFCEKSCQPAGIQNWQLIVSAHMELYRIKTPVILEVSLSSAIIDVLHFLGKKLTIFFINFSN